MRLQLNYSIKFDQFAFTKQQLKRLESLVNNILYDFKLTIFFMITLRMYFSFFTCEVKCDVVALDIVDRQNAYSITIVAKGVVELYRAIKREKKLYQKILVFSISHDYSSMRIYDYYTLINKSEIIFYRHLIKEFYFTSEESKDK